MKLNTLLAKTDILGGSYKACLRDYIHFFKNRQAAFLGVKMTYTPKPDTIDEPKRRKNTVVQATVIEKLTWLVENNAAYLDALFAQEKTNSTGLAKAHLIVDGEDWGEYSSLELLRLKSFLEASELKTMYSNIPVRSDSEEWNPSLNEMYTDREVFETPLMAYENKTTEKEQYILKDPNLTEGTTNYVPQVAVKNTTVTLGSGTTQNFSGEWSQRQRAETLARVEKLRLAVVEALKRANDIEVTFSDLSAEKIFSYLHGE